MPNDATGPLSRLWQGLRKKTSDAVGRQAIGYMRGKIAGSTVTDDAGNVLVDAGHVIDDDVIARAEAAGKLGALASAAAVAQTQDLKEKATEHFEQTPQGRENWALETAEAYAEARRYRGYIAGVDVTNIRGEVIIPAGKQLDEDDIRAAREADQLAALAFSAEQGGPAPYRQVTATTAPEGKPTAPVLTDPPAPPRRAPLPVIRRDSPSQDHTTDD